MTVVNGVRLVSNSEVQTFKDCPRKWWLAWHRGLKSRRQSVVGVRSTGTRLHVGLAALYTPEGTPVAATAALAREQMTDSLELQHQQASLNFSEPYVESQRDKMNEQETELRKSFDLEHAMLEGYLDWIAETGADSHLEVISSEKRVEVDFVVVKMRYPVKLIAKIDARVRSLLTGAIKFIDHKTVGSLQDSTLGINPQMLHYHVIEDLLTEPGQPRAAGALYNMLKRSKRTRAAKPPFYARIPIDHNKFELDGYRRQLHGVIERIENTEQDLESAPWAYQSIVPPRPSRDCTWKCEFFKVCRMFDDGSRVEAAIEEHYVVSDPLSYYEESEDGDSGSTTNTW